MTNESTAFWQEKLSPLLLAFAEHVSLDQLAALRDEVRKNARLRNAESLQGPPMVLLDTLYSLRVIVNNIDMDGTFRATNPEQMELLHNLAGAQRQVADHLDEALKL